MCFSGSPCRSRSSVFWVGELRFEAMAKIYAVLFSSAILYHLTGYAAGFVIRSRRLGARIVQVAVFLPAIFVLDKEASINAFAPTRHSTAQSVSCGRSRNASSPA